MVKWCIAQNWTQAESQVRKATFFDMEKVSSTIKQFYRDWSEEVSIDILNI